MFKYKLESVTWRSMIMSKLLAFGQHPYFFWPNHTLYALGRLWGLSRFKNMLPKQAKLLLMPLLVLLACFYCHPVYGNSISKGDTDRIQSSKILPFLLSLIFGSCVQPLKSYQYVAYWRQEHELASMIRAKSCPH